VTETNVFQISQPGTFTDPMTEVLRSGARASLTQAVEAEVAALLNCHTDKLSPMTAASGWCASDDGANRRSATTSNSRKVFVVHGHGGVEHAVGGFLRKLGLEPVILHEQPNEGRTIIEKLGYSSTRMVL
jgi:predicted nucleotide-binding protein